MSATKIKLNQLQQDSATSDQVLTWDGSSWIPQDSPAGGIYSGSGTIPGSTVASLTNNLEIQFASTAPAIQIFGGAITGVYMTSADGSTNCYVEDNGRFELSGNDLGSVAAGSLILAGTTDLTVDIAGATGTAGQVLTAVGDGTTVWNDVPSGGIYGGSGDMFSGGVATLQSGSSFTFAYNSANTALLLDDTSGITIASPDGNEYIEVVDNAINLVTNSGDFLLQATDTSISAIYSTLHQIAVDATGIKIHMDNDTGTGGYVLTAIGDGYATWAPAGGADGNGIYDGSGTIPASTIATLTTGEDFRFHYASAGRAIRINDASGYVRIYGDDSNATELNVSPGSIYADTTDQFDVRVNSVQRLTVSDTSGFSGWTSANTLGIGAATTLDLDAGTAMNLVSPYTAIKDSTNAGVLRIYEPVASGTNYFALTAQAMASDYTYTWPANYGTDNYALVTNGSGTLTWEPAGIYGGSGTIASGAVATVTASSLFKVNYSTANPAFQVDDLDNSTTLFSDSGDVFVYVNDLAVVAGGPTYYVTIAEDDQSITLNTPASVLEVYSNSIHLGADIVNVGGGTSATEMRFLEPSGSGANYTAFKAQAQSGNITYLLPAAAGSDGQVLTWNTGGTLTWENGRLLTGSATLNFPSTSAMTSSDLTITVTGAADGDPVSLGVPNGSTLANGCFTAWVSATNTVTVRFTNNGLTSLDPASGTFKVTVQK